MNHIKKFKEVYYTDIDLDNLSEYLQELFDKFNISYYKNGQYSTKDYDNNIYWDIYYSVGCICIFNIKKNAKEIIEELNKIKPLIEKRLGKKLNFNHINISNIYIGILKNINESKISKIERLSDYLQEVFDKYNISVNSQHNINKWEIYKNSIWIISHDLDLLHEINHEIYKKIPYLESRCGFKVQAYLDDKIGYIKVHESPKNTQKLLNRHTTSIKEALYLDKEIERMKIEDLADYLQEIFDDNKISQNVDLGPFAWPSNNSWKINFSDTLGNNNIRIVIDSDKLRKFLSDIHQNLPLLKRRINANIKIDAPEKNFSQNSIITISIDIKKKQDFYHHKKKRKKEANLNRRKQ